MWVIYNLMCLCVIGIMKLALPFFRWVLLLSTALISNQVKLSMDDIKHLHHRREMLIRWVHVISVSLQGI